MNTTFRILNRAVTLAVTVAALSFVSLAAQDRQAENASATDAQAETRILQHATLAQPQLEYRVMPQLEVQDFAVPYLLTWDTSQLASDDGEYLAQNQTELQTYYDLGMTYKYISEDYLRRQLPLPDGKGLFVMTVDDEGEGRKNGFRAGDIIARVDELPIDTQYDFVIALAQDRGQSRSTKVVRDGAAIDLDIALTARTDEPEKQRTRYILGVTLDDISDVAKSQLGIESGAAVTSLTEDAPAQAMGVRVHDIIVAIDGSSISNLDDLKKVVEGSEGKTVTVDLIRGGNNLSIELQPKQVPVANATYGYSVTRSVPLKIRYNTPELIVNRAITLVQPNDLVQTNDVIAQIEVQPTQSKSTAQQLDEILDAIEQLETRVKELRAETEKND